MPRIAEQALPVTGGVDTHADMHVAAVVDQVGRVLGTEACPATAAGYRTVLAWMSSHGELAKVGVEGTGSYGAGLARYLATCGVAVVEVIRPNRQARRQRGKSDAADAVAAALAALNGEAAGGCRRATTGRWSRSGRCGWPAAARSRPAPRRATSCAT
jgi:transposase